MDTQRPNSQQTIYNRFRQWTGQVWKNDKLGVLGTTLPLLCFLGFAWQRWKAEHGITRMVFSPYKVTRLEAYSKWSCVFFSAFYLFKLVIDNLKAVPIRKKSKPQPKGLSRSAHTTPTKNRRQSKTQIFAYNQSKNSIQKLTDEIRLIPYKNRSKFKSLLETNKTFIFNNVLFPLEFQRNQAIISANTLYSQAAKEKYWCITKFRLIRNLTLLSKKLLPPTQLPSSHQKQMKPKKEKDLSLDSRIAKMTTALNDYTVIEKQVRELTYTQRSDASKIKTIYISPIGKTFEILRSPNTKEQAWNSAKHTLSCQIINLCNSLLIETIHEPYAVPLQTIHKTSYKDRNGLTETVGTLNELLCKNVCKICDEFSVFLELEKINKDMISDWDKEKNRLLNLIGDKRNASDINKLRLINYDKRKEAINILSTWKKPTENADNKTLTKLKKHFKATYKSVWWNKKNKMLCQIRDEFHFIFGKKLPTKIEGFIQKIGNSSYGDRSDMQKSVKLLKEGTKPDNKLADSKISKRDWLIVQNQLLAKLSDQSVLFAMKSLDNQITQFIGLINKACLAKHSRRENLNQTLNDVAEQLGDDMNRETELSISLLSHKKTDQTNWTSHLSEVISYSYLVLISRLKLLSKCVSSHQSTRKVFAFDSSKSGQSTAT